MPLALFVLVLIASVGTYIIGYKIGVGKERARLEAMTKAEKAKTKRDYDLDEPKQEFYGHCWSPTTELRQALPPPPSGCAWEVKVIVNEKGEHVMTLGQFDILSEVIVASTEANLVQKDYDTWAGFNAKYSTLRRKEFEIDLIVPMVEWAKRQSLKGTAGDGSVEYYLDA